eukprot:TRINITY_DN5059_c0_g1_i1.p1 TRINITY_DN5059_c0_g1~~TRINITY_DN5059_c0_g1_i1.p1  ORF type:complete len:540 (-),score=172.54 TRINITY_DN5059_c0_g1_i1:380-1999(-)
MGKLEDLMAMGFDRNKAQGALKMAGNDVDAALTILFAQVDEKANSSPPLASAGSGGKSGAAADVIDVPRRIREFTLGASVELRVGDWWVRGMVSYTTAEAVQIQYVNESNALMQRTIAIDHKDLAFEGTHIPAGKDKAKAGSASSSGNGGAGSGSGEGSVYEFGSTVLVNVGQGVWVSGMVVAAEAKNILVQYVDLNNRAGQRKFHVSSEDVKLDVESMKPAVDPSNEERKVEVSALAQFPPNYPLKLEVGMDIDYRDPADLGKWVKAKVVGLELLTLEIQVGSQVKKLNVIQERDSLAPYETYTRRKFDENFLVVAPGDWVSVWALQPVDLRQWVQGEVVRLDSSEAQVLIRYENWGATHQNWYPLNRTAELFEVCRVEEMEFKQIACAEHEHKVSEKFVIARGGMLRVLDSRGFWCMAQICNHDSFGGVRIQIHYERWTSKFDEWICLNSSDFRALSIAECEALPDLYRTEENAIQDEADIYFRKQMKEKGMDYVAVSKDGNCLYRSFAHQVFGEISRYEEVRGMCCQYMVRLWVGT